MSQYVPGHAPALLKLSATKDIAETGVSQIKVTTGIRVKATSRLSSGEHRLMQVLNDVFADSPESALGMSDKVRLMLAARERIQAGIQLM